MGTKWTSLAFIALVASCITTNSPHQLSFRPMGYDSLTAFVFQVQQFDSAKNLTMIDTLGLFCSDVRFINPGQNYSQWEMLTGTSTGFAEKGNRLNNTFEGISVTDTDLFIHPPRNYYRILQFCPYPYFKKQFAIGDSWNWDLNIGSLWAMNPVYPLQKAETFHNRYTYADTQIIKTSLGNLFCYHINATSTSIFGTSHASYFLSSEYGIVYCELKAINQQLFVFNLISKLKGEDALRCDGSFRLHYSYWKHPQQNRTMP